MITAYKTVGDDLVKTDAIGEKGTWVNLLNPTEEEILRVHRELSIVLDFLRAPLDEEERPRIESDEGQVMVLINVPIVHGNGDPVLYDTIPVGVIIAEDNVVTVCLQDNPILAELAGGRPKTLYTFKKTRFLLQVLFKTAGLYLKYLRQIDKQTAEIEERLHRSMKNEELIKLLNLEKSLVYFTTSLKSNEIVMEKLLRLYLVKTDPASHAPTRVLRAYPEDEDLLEDVITENKQAIEMGDIYTSILTGMMDAFASMISNNLNIVMKFLTSVTIVLSIPTIVASFYGMNVSLPFQRSPYAFLGTMAVSALASLSAVIMLARRRMF
ncbi:MAG: magnesium transporter CorA family protein [Firmicutes bacterium]|nr:magnesium transporter CorA family protein [Bacillota bacterium]MDH7494528.1 magnesium transporter CorA family protein [Bacillota bacterium]